MADRGRHIAEREQGGREVQVGRWILREGGQTLPKQGGGFGRPAGGLEADPIMQLGPRVARCGGVRAGQQIQRLTDRTHAQPAKPQQAQDIGDRRGFGRRRLQHFGGAQIVATSIAIFSNSDQVLIHATQTYQTAGNRGRGPDKLILLQLVR
jgi:hypothetical protein